MLPLVHETPAVVLIAHFNFLANLQQLRHEQNNRPRRFNRKGERRRPRRR